MEREIRYLLDRGAEGDDQEALRLCDEALASGGVSPELLVLKSEVLRNLELYAEAVEAARTAARLRDGAASAHLAYAEALIDLADESGDDTLLEEAAAALDAAIERDRELWRAWYWRAELHVRRGQPGLALEILPWIALHTNWHVTYVRRTERLIFDGARPHPEGVRAPRALHPDVQRLLGIALRAAGDFPAAREEFVSAAHRDPLSPELAYQLALTELAAGFSHGALTWLEWPCQVEGFYEAHELAAITLLRQRRIPKAREHLEEAIRSARSLGADEAYVGRLEKAALELSDKLADPRYALEPEQKSVHDEVLAAAAREQRLRTANRDFAAHCLQMARTACRRFEDFGRDPSVAWYMIRTAGVHSHPALSDAAWEGAQEQAGESWARLDDNERLALAGIMVLGEWLNASDDFDGKDWRVLAVATAKLVEGVARATGDEASIGEAEEFAERVGAAPGSLDRDAAWGLVAQAIGPRGEAGLLQAAAMTRPERKVR